MTSQPESKLSRKIMAELRSRGAFVWKNHGGPTMMNGLPDIAGVYRGFFIGIETKMPEGGDASPVQQLRHRQIRAAGGVVEVARSVAEAVTVLARIDARIDVP
jgi:Holliday junction resolvase